MSNLNEMNKINLLKKHAVTYLSKYNSTKKNLERILKNKVSKMKYLETNEKNHLYKKIKQIIENLESNNIINDENFTNTKIRSLFLQGKSEAFIKHTLLKKGVDKKIINFLLSKFEKNNPDWEINSAKKFASKKKLGIYGKSKNKEKDFAKMSRAGFNYNIALKALEYD
jgi:SOS response regulatory protein OraA/RecX